jgi:hypothetical protein
MRFLNLTHTAYGEQHATLWNALQSESITSIHPVPEVHCTVVPLPVAVVHALQLVNKFVASSKSGVDNPAS